MPILSETFGTGLETSPITLEPTLSAKQSSLPSKSLPPPCRVIHGDWSSLPASVSGWVRERILLCKPSALHIMDGSVEEDASLKQMLVRSGVLIRLKYDNCFLARTDPRDVARVESKTFICTETRAEAVPEVEAKGLGNWMHPDELDRRVDDLFPGCMNNRVMYLIPFSMGPVDGKLSKVGVQLTDSAYVAISMRIMTRISPKVFEIVEKTQEFVKCLHSVGCPLKRDQQDVLWPCNPEQTIIAHKPQSLEIISFGSGYGGNSLLGKKCFALRIGSALAQSQGWLAEHMLIMGVKERRSGKKSYLCAAFPSACGKTNLAMLQPTMDDYEISCVGDDIAWLRFDQGQLRAINPENGFFGVAPGTSQDSNPVAMATIFKDTLFTNVALTDDNGVWWEGMTDVAPSHLIDWLGNDWTPDCGRKAAHPNSRFCSPAQNCPMLDSDWESAVPISAILFGGRRPEGVPLVTEARDWKHAVFMGAALKSEATAAAEHKAKVIMHDPFSMRPFFGLNFGQYLSHWLKLGKINAHCLPKVFMVNWFRKDAETNKFLWPGFGDNIRVLDWILQRCGDNRQIVQESKLGLMPKKGSINVQGLTVDFDALFSVPQDFWRQEVEELRQYFQTHVGKSLPEEIWDELDRLEQNFETHDQ